MGMDSIIFRMFADTPKCWEYIVVNVSGQLFGLQYLN